MTTRSYNNVYDSMSAVSTNTREAKRGYLRNLFSTHFSSFKSKKGGTEAADAQSKKTAPTPLPKVKDQKRNSVDSPSWANRLWQQARDEMKAIEAEKAVVARPAPQPRKLPQTQKEKVAAMQEDLMRLVKEAESTGKIQITRRRSSEHMLHKMKQMQQDLLHLVKEAEQGGHLRILRRKSTESIAMPGHGKVQLVPIKK